MPKQSEIAAWLRDAAVSCGAFGEHCKSEKFRQRAAQVENMRCEVCNKSHWCVAYMVIGEDALGFGCFSHEAKTRRLRRVSPIAR